MWGSFCIGNVHHLINVYGKSTFTYNTGDENFHQTGLTEVQDQPLHEQSTSICCLCY